ncbi:DNA-binding response OmpR family regulator [Acetoanaerobium pronyense]|uniref:Stage 0 sporulation protein A homolog n=1 Tax=Acetoanaerobium pronyense TaxID=1482736 RepID=A0ABS4KJA3_9FIRM|nr:response regulator transcription factor [Acetoanaerobium pronyense]MBP2027834.1 DNA-binding response OmpR family regulator [Acetoanaerobium pronyense]
MKYKVLVIEDERDIREIVVKYLENADYEVHEGINGIQGLKKFREITPHIVILDIMMPDITGFEVLEELRKISDIPVIMLTAKQEEIDRLHGFDLGADDYVLKPFSPKELTKRVEAILKRVHSKSSKDSFLRSGELILDLKKYKLFKNNDEIIITTKEFNILKVFFENPEVVFSRENLIESAFGYDYIGFDRNIDSYIKNLRSKIEDDVKNPKYLKTKYGAGYVFGGKFNDN